MTTKRKTDGDKKMKTDKTTVKFTKTDGKNPANTPWGVNLRLPMQVTVPPAESLGLPGVFKIKMGLRCDSPLLCWPDPKLDEYGLELAGGTHVQDSGDELFFILKNKSTKPVTFEAGAAIVRATILTGAAVEVVTVG